MASPSKQIPCVINPVRNCDVLVVGSGLAGLRAAIAAAEHSGVDVLLISQDRGPSGASFTNPNQRLGLLVCHTDDEKDAVVRTALDLAAPGDIDRPLTEHLVMESDAVFTDLVHTGLSFMAAPGSPDLYRAPPCFLKEMPLAYILTDLPGAYRQMKNRFLRQGRLIQGLTIDALVQDETGCLSGALACDLKTHTIHPIRCRSLVMAAGGPAGLFPRTHSSGTGHSLALMYEAGARMVNTPYMQFLWGDVRTGAFWDCIRLKEGGAQIRRPDASAIAIPDAIRELCDLRSTHAPLSHGRDDAAVDDFLLTHASPRGEVQVLSPGREIETIALFAHAGNGGARIDADGHTSTPGLFACGECAGGMHGANRIGGAMVLSTQVFGRRAGDAAAHFAKNRPFEPLFLFQDRIRNITASRVHDPLERNRGLNTLADILAGHMGPLPRLRNDRQVQALQTLGASTNDRQLRLAHIAAGLLLDENSP